MRNYKQPMFQKRHYEFLASVLAEYGRQDISLKMARALKADNPNFNYDRFLTACGVDD